MLFVIAYDVKKTKSRNKIAALLESYGVRVNLSVFECDLKKHQLIKLRDEIANLANPKTDNIRFYNLCANCLEKSFVLKGNKQKRVFEIEEYIF